MQLWDWMALLLVIPLVLVVASLTILTMFFIVARRLRRVEQQVVLLGKRVQHLQSRSGATSIRAVTQGVRALEDLASTSMAPYYNGVAPGNGRRTIRLETYLGACRSFAQRTLTEGRDQASVDAVVRLVLHRRIREDPVSRLQLQRLLTKEEFVRWL